MCGIKHNLYINFNIKYSDTLILCSKKYKLYMADVDSLKDL